MNTSFNKILVVFDGLPGSGKTTTVDWLSSEYHGLAIPEVPEHNLSKPFTEEYFINCEEIKIGRFINSKHEFNFMDRSPISIVAHDYGCFKLGYENDNYQLNKWFQTQITKINLKNTLFVYPRISNVKLCNLRKWGENLEKLPKEFKTIQGARLWTEDKFLEIVKVFYDDFYGNIKNKLVIDCDMISLEKMFSLIKHKIDST
ncbi:hypothetical protein A3H89_01560 [Candidatus Amesbacteria bacterium RIFCSPLOWO2_02_FULL_48_11]|nr:MAG: hypothetical protein A3H89_01560 [Candidatus Amesbacteria bacterium RIFCSPLOWO2_02_FULL_48_11]